MASFFLLSPLGVPKVTVFTGVSMAAAWAEFLANDSLLVAEGGGLVETAQSLLNVS